tara:strand:- start:1631 stop:2392 length:762 start_codon:yes stop_codon:yes gene_type:complete
MSYKRSKYFITRSNAKIKYLFSKKNSQITVVFFHGFMSDMVGEKPQAIKRFCNKNNLNFLSFEYSGHGKSTGEFVKGNISKWTNEAKDLINLKVKKNSKLIFVGSSMGSWIALNLFSSFKKKLKGFIGIGSAPEFLEKLMWKKFDKKTKKIIMTKKIYHLKHGDFTYPITKQIILDGKKNKVLNNKINLKIPITLFHGRKDRVVPVAFSKNILKFCKKSTKKLIIIKNGEHRLSRKSDLKKICSELNFIVSGL